MSRRPVSGLVLTLDIDWAPDFMIDDVAQILIDRKVKATWFVTHGSPAVDRLRARPDLFELGMHPNFLPGSTHGDTPAEVLASCRALLPEARTMRTHGLVQSTPLLDAAIENGVEIDVSLYLPHAEHAAPLEYWREGRRLWRIPYVWEDDFEMDRPSPVWSAAPFAGREGLQILNFHPIHVWLNGADMEPYRALKQRCAPLSMASRSDAEPLRHAGAGPRQLFEEVADHLAGNGLSRRICDVIPALAEATG